MTTTFKIYECSHKHTERRMLWLLKFEGDNSDCATFDPKFSVYTVRQCADCYPDRITWLGSDYWDSFAAWADAKLVARWTVTDSWFATEETYGTEA